MPVWINEFHYDNVGTDTGEFIELAGTAGTSLAGWQLVRYNGTNPNAAIVYTSPGTITLGGVIPDQQNGFGTLSFTVTTDGIQNGPTDGFALVDASATVVQLLSYEGVFTASNGPAAGQTSTAIPVGELGTEAAGGSLTLTGDGTAYADFTWTKVTDDSPGAVNAGQSFGGPPPNETVSIADASIIEGDSGTALLTFTVTRSGNAGAFDVGFATADGTATAGSDYTANTGTLSFAAGGALTATITVEIAGDTLAEPNETLGVVLSGLIDSTGTTTIADSSATGTITNDELTFTRIFDVQGVGHRAPAIGGGVADGSVTSTARINVEGVVTGIAQNGFYFQDATGDGDDRTSDGIFVFTGTNAAVLSTLAAGDTVRVLNAPTAEFRSATNNLSVTQLTGNASGASIQNLGGDTAIDAVVLGVERFIPTGSISDPGFATYDIATDAADFWESLEGMLVEVPTSIATSPTNEFRARDPFNSTQAGPPSEELWVRVPANTAPGSQTAEGGLLLGPTDANPERIQLDDIRTAIDLPDADVGATIGTIQGVVNYDFGNYEVLVSTSPVVVEASPITQETTDLAADFRQITIGVYNVENLDVEVENTSAWGTGGVAADGTGGVTGVSFGNASGDQYTRDGNSDDDVGTGKLDTHARQIAFNMGAPTIVALQEVQDNDGAEISTDVDATRTLQALVDAIFEVSGIRYDFAFENPPTSNVDGGQPNANIRPAFLYRADLVTLVDTIRLTDPNPGEADGFSGDDFTASRKPLVGIFERNGVEFTVVNNHFNSKGGDNALFGNVQPPVLSSELQRIEQARIVHDYVVGLGTDAKALVLGDLNDFSWSNPLRTLRGTGDDQVLFDLADELLPPTERYSYNFEGNAQELDHTLVTGNLLDGADAAFDIVHVNSEFADQVSDHDPSVARLDFTAFGERLRLTSGADAIDGGGGDDRIVARGGADTVGGGGGDDRLKGGPGADLFVFGPDGGQDKVLDFQPGEDRIDLTAYAALGVDGFEDLEISGNGSAARIHLASGGLTEIRLMGIDAAALTAADFVFG